MDIEHQLRATTSSLQSLEIVSRKSNQLSNKAVREDRVKNSIQVEEEDGLTYTFVTLKVQDEFIGKETDQSVSSYIERLKAPSHKNLAKYASLGRPIKSEITAKILSPPLGTLGELIDRQGMSLSESDIVKAIGEICEGLKELHSKHIIHLALCPKTILVYESEGKEEMKLALYGMSKVCEQVAESEYLPKITKGHVKQVDMYSLGVVILQMCTGTAKVSESSESSLFEDEVLSVWDYREKGQTIQLPRIYSKNLNDLVNNLTSLEQNARPSAIQVLSLLTDWKCSEPSLGKDG